MSSFYDKLIKIIQKNKSFLCLGLDTDYSLLPLKDKNIFKSIYQFNKTIIDNTKDLVCCYKLNSAFYEKYGADGLDVLKKSIKYIGKEIPVIVDAKRCDIGNSSKYYAEYGFNYLNADAITVIPYMGIDAIEPFLQNKNKFVFTVILSSNPGGSDFQTFPFFNPLYLKVIKKINQKYSNSGFVFGATKPEYIKTIRNKNINNLLLIPGIGTQGGEIEKTIKYTFLKNNLGIFNISRGIIYSGQGKQYYNTIREKTLYYRALLQPK